MDTPDPKLAAIEAAFAPEKAPNAAALATEELAVLADGHALARKLGHRDPRESAEAYLEGWRVTAVRARKAVQHAVKIAGSAERAIKTHLRVDELVRRLVAVRHGFHVVELYEASRDSGLVQSLCWLLMNPDGLFVAAFANEALAISALEEVSDRPGVAFGATPGRL